MLGMTWQHTFLFWEMLASGAISLWLIRTGRDINRKPWPWLLVNMWDTAMLVLLLFGTKAVTWQIQGLALMYAVLVPFGVWATFSRRPLKFTPEGTTTKKQMYVATSLLTLGYLGLLIGGQP